MIGERKFIVSKAHEVVQGTTSGLVCLRCGLRGDLKKLFGPTDRCVPHLETSTSGWLNEEDCPK